MACTWLKSQHWWNLFVPFVWNYSQKWEIIKIRTTRLSLYSLNFSLSIINTCKCYSDFGMKIRFWLCLCSNNVFLVIEQKSVVGICKRNHTTNFWLYNVFIVRPKIRRKWLSALTEKKKIPLLLETRLKSESHPEKMRNTCVCSVARNIRECFCKGGTSSLFNFEWKFARRLRARSSLYMSETHSDPSDSFAALLAQNRTSRNSERTKED